MSVLERLYRSVADKLKVLIGELCF